MNNYCVYKHTSPSNKIYIGVTGRNPIKRWKSGWGYINNQYFTRAIQKYGWDNFKHEILFSNLTKEEACKKEIELIKFYKSNNYKFGYNISSGGDAHRGCKHSEESKKKIGEASKINNPRYWKGKHLTEDAKRKISETKKGIPNLYLSKKVKCIETNIIYNSTMDAERQTGIYSSNIAKVCKGRAKTTGGYHWEYVC